MNWLGLLAVGLGFPGYVLGICWARKPLTRGSAVLVVGALSVFAVPAIVYDLYYSKLLGEPIWLYRIRAVPGSELLASLAGILAGWAQVRIVPHLRLSGIGMRFLAPVVIGFALALPYLKPLLRPLRTGVLRDEWKGEACLQSAPSTCGPAAAATIVHRLGRNHSEQEFARESFTCRSGTESWYLARALRRHGFHADFLLSNPSNVPLPAIAGVRLRSQANAGHFIALLERHGSDVLAADPMEGSLTNTVADLERLYEFTGFFLTIRATDSKR